MEWGKRRVTANWQEGALWVIKHVLKLDHSEGCTITRFSLVTKQTLLRTGYAPHLSALQE